MAQTSTERSQTQRDRNKARRMFAAEIMEEIAGEIGESITLSVSSDAENITIHWGGEPWAYEYLDKMCQEKGFSFGLVQRDIDLIIVERAREKLRFETIMNPRPSKRSK